MDQLPFRQSFWTSTAVKHVKDRHPVWLAAFKLHSLEELNCFFVETVLCIAADDGVPGHYLALLQSLEDPRCVFQSNCTFLYHGVDPFAEVDVFHGCTDVQGRQEGDGLWFSAFKLHLMEQKNGLVADPLLNIPGEKDVPRDEVTLFHDLEGFPRLADVATNTVHVDEGVPQQQAGVQAALLKEAMHQNSGFQVLSRSASTENDEEERSVHLNTFELSLMEQTESIRVATKIRAAMYDRSPCNDGPHSQCVEHSSCILVAPAVAVHVHDGRTDHGVDQESGLGAESLDELSLRCLRRAFAGTG